MKTKLTFLLLLIFAFCNAQIVNIPDANFKAKLLAANYGNIIAKNLSGYYFKIDTNNDGEIQISEASQVSALGVSFSSITNLEGIQFFSQLSELVCPENQILNINLSSLPNLTRIDCSYNLVNSLNIINLPNLQTLLCNDNQITSLDLTGCTSLGILNCSTNNISTLIFPSPHPLFGYSFSDIFCQNNQLTSLSLNNFRYLQTLNCNNNLLTTISISNSPYLSELNCSFNQISQLNTSNLTALEVLKCNNNLLTELDINKNKGINYLNCSYNQIIFLKIKTGRNITTTIFNNNSNLRYICCDFSRIVSIQNTAFQNGYSGGSVEVNSYCTFQPGENFYTILGSNKYDFNSNGCDLGDGFFPSLKINIINSTNTGSFISNSNGLYSFSIQAGTHSITPKLENPTYYNVSPSVSNVTFPSTASPLTQNFCITPNGIHHDLEIIIIPVGVARPGFDATYKLIYKNKGNVVESGTVSASYPDAILDFVSSSLPVTTQTYGNLIWNFTNLQPFETREITFTLNVNSPTETPAVNAGTQLNFTAIISSPNLDEEPSDSGFDFKQIVVNSFDPNDKTCLQGTTISQTNVGDYVHYMIRFENTGTFPAENVVIKDLIDLTKFDINTLVPMKGSHNFETRFYDNNKVEFIFENINLPFDDANNDGYVVFKNKSSFGYR